MEEKIAKDLDFSNFPATPTPQTKTGEVATEPGELKSLFSTHPTQPRQKVFIIIAVIVICVITSISILIFARDTGTPINPSETFNGAPSNKIPKWIQ